MTKAMTIKEALKKWEELHPGQLAAEATDIQLQFQWPPIEKMDATLSTLVNCQKLSLSTNMIDRIAGLNGLSNLTILSLARNNIKSLAGIELVGETLQELWISYNIIDKLKGMEALKKLRVFYISNNAVRDLTQVNALAHLPALVDFVFTGNVDDMDPNQYRREICRRLQNLKILDGIPIVRDL